MGRIRRLSRLRWLHDREYREALRLVKSAQSFQIVDYTDKGIAIKMPAHLVSTWNAMPPDIQQQFMDDVDAARQDDDRRNHEWRG